MYPTRIVLVALAAVVTACAPAGPGAADTAATPRAADAEEAEAARITADEIRTVGLPNAYELVYRLRRAWLRRDPLTGGEVAVYVDDRNVGGADRLREIPAVDVAELRYLPNDKAAMRWGMAVEGSVIVVVLQR